MLTKYLVFIVLFFNVNGREKKENALQLTEQRLQSYIEKEDDPSVSGWVFKQPAVSGLIKAEKQNATYDSILCRVCSTVMEVIITKIKEGMTEKRLSDELLNFCTSFHIETEKVCRGMINLNAGILIYVINTTKEMDGKKMCSFLSEGSLCPPDKYYDWTIRIPPGKTVTLPQKRGEKSFNILHVTDIHYDKAYTPGKDMLCGEPLCCQSDQKDGTGQSLCGYWGSYKNADSPMHTIEETLKQSRSHHFDYVYFTGDIIGHRDWSTSIESNTKYITTIYDKLAAYYKNVSIFPILGNHEATPINQYDIYNNSTSWLYKTAFKLWSRWLPVAEVKDTILRGGFYTVSPRKGFRIIAMNNNICSVLDWWLLKGVHDPYGQLEWLAEILEKAEKNGERVHILAHIPTAACSLVWSREYSKIVERFANTIAAQFNGHTHFDEFNVYYNKSDETQAINVAWNGASVTTFTDNNPSYKLYQIDEKIFDVTDYEEWTFNLTLANENSKVSPKWYKLYSFKKAYGVKNLEPKELNNLLLRMTTNHTLIDLFNRYRYRNSDTSIKFGCNEQCQKDILCTIATTDSGYKKKCEFLIQLYEKSKSS